MMTIKKVQKKSPLFKVTDFIRALEDSEDPIPVPKFGCIECDHPDSAAKKKKIWLSCGHIVHYACIKTPSYSTRKPNKWLCPICIKFVLTVGVLFG
ncbi:RING-type domain-containing protein [Trichonephila inaurata madagascariensis]|uniref:RING-type domain-containing protein n=1 Tax=Trichonephila inaurata madagascariensis TaxID=2747483 RepID=A0A8X6XHM9_9ARAC|nr:RING-type domain-containing protein [Trichonephila inaurata madagascariensis]